MLIRSGDTTEGGTIAYRCFLIPEGNESSEIDMIPDSTNNSL